MEKYPLEDRQHASEELKALTVLKQTDSISNNIAVFDSFESLNLKDYRSLHGVVLILVDRGNCELEVNLKKVSLSKGGVYMCFTGQVVKMLSMSDDFKPLCVGCSQNMVDELMSYTEDSFRMFFLTKQVPYMQWEPEKFAQLKQSFEFLRLKIQTTKENKFYYNIVKNCMLAFAFECFGFMIENINVHSRSSRKVSLFSAFMRSVEKNHRKEHSVKFYADELFVTPKYLSAVIDELSGKGAKQWIDEYVALTAKFLLRTTRMDIQEISEELNFPDISFFGKFFKRIVGMSPKGFRAHGLCI